MQFSALRYFLETARLGSIRRAAEILYVAPSAVSRQIALLEQDFGAPLFERHAAGMRLTAAGEIFAQQASATRRDFERLRSDLDDLQQLRRGSVKIFSIEGAVAGLLYRAITHFVREHPGISYEIRVAGSSKALGALARDECDIAIAFNPEAHGDVEEEKSFRDPIVAVMHPGHPLARHPKLTLDDLAKHRVALVDDSHVTRTLMDRALASAGVTLQASLAINQIGLAIAYARKGMALTFAPRHIVREDVQAGTLRTVAIDHPSLQGTRTVLCRHKTRPPTRPAQAFLAALRREFSAAAAEGRKRR
ncbi:MAG TPA: LysR family transcriptional regulator [Steroidobacteraceae bacterium]|nr:LysR family transcriptional regulator [Steroidobacteraceae bacterium]